MKKNLPTVKEYGVNNLKPGDKLHFWANSIAVVTLVAKDKKGNYRFVDGISAALKFKAVPAKLGDVVDTMVGK